MINFSEIKNIHFLGIGGVSLSSFARFFHRKGYKVSGTDKSYSSTLDSLSEEGINVRVGFSPEAFPKPDLVIYSSAIPENDTELMYMRANGVKCIERYILLGELSAKFSYTIAIGGTHGKTTVTGMCGCVMKSVSLPFYAHVGGDCENLGVCHYSGDKYFLCEACEYKKSLLALFPYIGVVLNAEFDHPDTYKSNTEIYDTFDTFLQRNPHGLSVVNGDCEYYRLRQRHLRPITFGFSVENDYRITDVVSLENGCFGCTITRLGIRFVDISLKIPGKHNLMNACACVAVCDILGISPNDIKKGIELFAGVKRRFEYCGMFFSAAVYSDYAHHPTEIAAAIDTAKLLGKRVSVVFQPHTYSRTSSLKEAFAKVLVESDNLIIVKEYAARETPENGINALSLYNECRTKNKVYCENIMDAAAELAKKTAPEDIILVLGAGDINNLCKILISTI